MTVIRRPSSARQVVSLEGGESAPTAGPYAIGETSSNAPPYPGPPSPGPLPIGLAFAIGGGDGEDGAPGPPGPPGPAGAAGSTGAVGPPGPIGFAIDGLDGQDGFGIPGVPGAAGVVGATGSQGPPGFSLDGEDGAEGMPIPGAPGPQGSPGIGIPGQDGLDGGDSIFLLSTGSNSGATGANPTATASDTAVNGSATTFMRSDAAPAVQKASASQFGIVEVDGTTITASGGVISAVGGGGSGGLTQLAQVTTTAGQTSVTLMSSIPGTYRNLILTMTGGSVSTNTTSSDTLALQFNGDGGSHYGYINTLNWSNSGTNTGNNSATSLVCSLLTSTGASGALITTSQITIFNYTNTALNISTNHDVQGWQSNVGIIRLTGAGFWKPTSLAAITSIVASSTGSAFSTGTVITLYGQS